MSSPRSMLPATVLLKLQEESYSRRKHNYYSQDRSSLCDNSDVVRRRCYSESAHISADTATNGVNMGGSLKGTRSPVRGARKSELGLSPPPSSFCLGASITKSTEHLGRISQELHTVNEELSNVVDAKRKLDSVGGSGASEDSSDGDVEAGGVIIDLCATANRELRVADLAKRELDCVLSELEMAWAFQERHMVSRAAALTREGEFCFEKMSPNALQRLQIGSDEEEDEEDEESQRGGGGVKIQSRRKCQQTEWRRQAHHSLSYWQE